MSFVSSSILRSPLGSRLGRSTADVLTILSECVYRSLNSWWNSWWNPSNWSWYISKAFSSLTPSLKTPSLTVQLPTCHKNFYSSSLFPHTSSLWNSLPRSCFPCEYDTQAFKCNVNRYLSLSLCSFLFFLVALCLVVPLALQRANY